MNEMIKRAALAMQELCEGPPRDFEIGGGGKRPHETYVRCARAAFQAAREPTEAMIDAVYTSNIGCIANQDVSARDLLAIYHLMIDAILKA
jgi:hypothetical protein